MTKIVRAETLDDALATLSSLVAEAEARGEKNLIFCEDRLTLLAERAVLSSRGGTFLSEVTTFARFLSGGERVLSKQGSVMKISEIILKRKGKDGCFSSSAARAVYETIAQLSASRVTAKMLADASQNTEGMLRRKTRDLSEILTEYEGFLAASGMVDENGYLALLPKRIEEAYLRDTNVIFFAFPSFTAQAMEGVRACLDCAKSVTGIFPGGELPLFTNRSVQSFLRLLRERGEEACVQDAPSTLTGERRELFELMFAPDGKKRKAGAIRTFEADDETQETEVVAALIKKHIAEGMRYHDIAVLVPNEAYFGTVEKVFRAYRIPFYAERKRKLSTHPFAEYVVNIFEAVADGVLPDEADAIVSSVCFGGAEEYRNYLARFGAYRGAVRRKIRSGDEIREFDEAELNACREKLLSVLSLFPERATAGEYAAAIRKLFEITKWEEVYERVCSDAARYGTGLSGEEQEFLQIGITQEDAFGKALWETEEIAGARVFGAREFSQIFRSGLDAAEVSMIPVSSDAVFLGDVASSALIRMKVLFAVGLTENVPVVGEDTAVITDGEISRLSQIKVEIEPAIQEVNARMREALARNLVCFDEALYLSRPLLSGGEESGKSEVLLAVEKSFFLPPMPEIFPYDCSERVPAVLKMLAEKEKFDGGESYSATRYNAIAGALGKGAQAVYALHETCAYAADLWFRGPVSPTLLESYFRCPYAGFASRALRLEERREQGNEADTGTFVHTVLQRAAGEFNTIGGEEKLRETVAKIAEELFSDPRFRSLSDTPRGEYTKDWLKKECHAVSLAAWEQLRDSSFRVRGTEETVALSELSLAGKADRIDEADGLVRVIDYKTGRYSDAVTSYYTGKYLQLELYLLAASEKGEPAGAFYFPAADGYSANGEDRFRMRGFYNADDAVFSKLDNRAGEGEESKLFAGKRGTVAENGLSGEDFRDFLQYAYLVSENAEREMKQGNVAPSPNGNTCRYCKYGALCGFTGVARSEPEIKSGEIVEIVRRNKS